MVACALGDKRSEGHGRVKEDAGLDRSYMEMRKTWRLSDMSTVAQLVFPVGYLGNTLEVVGTITQAFRW